MVPLLVPLVIFNAVFFPPLVLLQYYVNSDVLASFVTFRVLITCSCCSEAGKKIGDHISWMEMNEQLLLCPWSVLNFGLEELVSYIPLYTVYASMWECELWEETERETVIWLVVMTKKEVISDAILSVQIKQTVFSQLLLCDETVT